MPKMPKSALGCHLYKELLDEVYNEYLEFLKSANPQQHLKELKEKSEVTHARFDFFKTGSSYVAEKEGLCASTYYDGTDAKSARYTIQCRQLG